MFRFFWGKNIKIGGLSIPLVSVSVLRCVFIDHPLIVLAIAKIGLLGYFGAFLSGAFLISAFTVAPLIVVIVLPRFSDESLGGGDHGGAWCSRW